MAITVPGMRSNKVSMDIDQIRGWATFMDRAMIVSLVVTILAVAALGITTWLSFRFSGAVRAHEHATVEQSKGMQSHSVQLEQDVATAQRRALVLEREVSAARERAVALEQEASAAKERAMALQQEVSTTKGRTVSLEQEVSTAKGRALALEQEVSTAKGRALALEQEVSAARERAAAFEQAARDANERAARADRESATTSEKAPTPQLDAAKIQQRLADLAKLVREATARTAEPTPGKAAEPSNPAQGESVAAGRDEQPSPIVAALRKYAGTQAALFVLERVSEAPAAASTISAYLSDAGWAPQTWTWTGVAGILGVVVLIKEGSDPATNEAASALVEALRSAGFNAAKADWPADWRRHRGALEGPQTPAPTDAAIRIVIGAKPR